MDQSMGADHLQSGRSPDDQPVWDGNHANQYYVL